jgi:diamine N-acetyltransferase
MMNTRTALLEDIALLTQLNQSVHQIHVDAHPELFKPVSPDDPALLLFYHDMIDDPNTVVYIVEVDGTGAGYIIARMTYRPENVFSHPLRAIYIDQIAVNPQYRKQGCGEALIQAVFALAKKENVSRVLLDVWDFNENAQQFFARMGFKNFNYRMDIHL